MDRFQYKAIQSDGVPVFGIDRALTQDALAESLKSRGLLLVDCKQLKWDRSAQMPEVTRRLMELRIGNRLREAILTGLPPHQAIRALAAEPIESPVLMLMPWLGFAGVATFLLLLLIAQITDIPKLLLAGTGILAVIVIPAFWATLWLIIRVKWRGTLNDLAGRIEAGAVDSGIWTSFVPYEVGCLLQSGAPREKQAVAMSQLMPMLSTNRLCRQRYAFSITAPLITICVTICALFVAAGYVAPLFERIFSDFGMQIPLPTRALIFLCNVGPVRMGLSGIGILFLFLLMHVCLLHVALSSVRTAGFAAAVPFVGVPVRWLAQARVSRLIGVSLQSGFSPEDALMAGIQGSGFRRIRQHGDLAVQRLRNGEHFVHLLPDLQAVPLPLIARRTSITATAASEQGAVFLNVARMLEDAGSGQGVFFAILVQTFVLVIVGVSVCFVILSMFLPLLRLLSDLATICLPFPTL
ncbi:MAG: type II secretion system F family protein [Planctomycetaceae bacterium]|nr:type II secretion system F family protein [Planctomycetaceae bacterium]